MNLFDLISDETEREKAIKYYQELSKVFISIRSVQFCCQFLRSLLGIESSVADPEVSDE